MVGVTDNNTKAKETFDKVMAKVKSTPIKVLPAIAVEEKEASYDTYEDVDAIKQRFNNISSPNNWNQVDVIDKQSWDKLISQFWVDTRIPVSKDMADYEALSPAEKVLMQRVFVGLTMLDTLQAEDGVLSLLISGKFDGFETSVLNKIAFDESIHNKSYSTIFQTLMTNSQEIDKVFQWSLENEFLQYKVKKIQQVYAEGSIYQKLIADVMLETFLFYSGFYLPVLWRGSKKMMNTSEIIALIIRK